MLGVLHRRAGMGSGTALSGPYSGSAGSGSGGYALDDSQEVKWRERGKHQEDYASIVVSLKQGLFLEM